MANKYIIHGATFNGDGTSSAEASSNGGVGAWNNINILTGTAPAYGTLAAGDVVYIRSKSSAGANITVTASATVNLGSSNATVAAPIKWVLDNGTVWSGINGVLTFTTATQSYVFNFLSNNIFVSQTEDAWVVQTTATQTGAATIATINDGATCVGLFFDVSQRTGNYAYKMLMHAGIAINCHFKYGQLRASSAFDISGYKRGVLINPRIELTDILNPGWIFQGTAYYTGLSIYGGRIYGAGASTGQRLYDPGAGTQGLTVEAVGLVIPVEIELCKTDETGPVGPQRFTAIGADGGVGAMMHDRWGFASSRNDGNFPTLNATLPDSASTPWSWWIYPWNCTQMQPMVMPVAKLYTSAAAAKTVRMEFLLSNSFAGVDTSDLWMDVSYIDNTTGLPVHLTTRENGPGGALSVSSAAWSATTYGAVTLSKKKFTVTTPTSIKQNTMVTATLMGLGILPDGSNDILFLCPDIQLDTV